MAKMRRDHCQEITDRIVKAMEAGVAEWKKPWANLGLAGLPFNGSTKRGYRGLNTLLLAMEGYADPRWYTFNQAKRALGYKKVGKAWVWSGSGEDPKHGVRKGEKGTQVFFWKFFEKVEEVEEDGKTVEKKRRFPMIKVYTVFNAEQIEGLAANNVEVCDSFQEAHDMIMGLGANISYGGNRACYFPEADRIQMPRPEQFTVQSDIENFWATLFHEITHWTGHDSRLGRDLTGRFGSDKYAMEELVAELGSAFLCGHFQVEGNLQHPEYLGSWIKRLRDDKYAIFKAATLAQQAADFALSGGQITNHHDADESGEAVAVVSAQAA